MNNNLDAIKVTQKSGLEHFLYNSNELESSLLSFWQWSGSDLVNNALRGVLAEYIVALAVGVCDEVRIEWDAYDVKTSSGTKVEVKSAAYLQSWTQKEVSNIQFNIKPTHAWDSASNTYAEEKSRQSDIYVFCLLAHMEKSTVNPLNLDQWEFYCVSTEKMNQELGPQKTLGLARLLKLNPTKTNFGELLKTIESVFENHL
ncbi:MAG: hypothetical protein AAGC93_29160 [Cyanobacteria bacterium P01_F01_bin.53]